MKLIKRLFEKPAPYLPILEEMQRITATRTPDACDQVWFLEHEPVFTQGQAGKAEHILAPGTIPVIQSDRGGQITYHGPGQIMMYVLLDLKRAHLSVRALVSLLENLMIDCLQLFDIKAHAKCDAPGVYVEDHKIGSLGLRIKRGYSYHGLSLNVAMDLEPFSRINPCGFKGMQMTHMQAFSPTITRERVQTHLEKIFIDRLGYAV